MVETLAFSYLEHNVPYDLIAFNWPTDKEIPVYIRKLTVQEFTNALELVAYTIESVKDKTNAGEFKDLLQKELQKYEDKLSSTIELSKAEKDAILEHHSSEKKHLEEKTNRTVSLLQKQIEELQSSLSNSRFAYDGLKSQLEDIKSSSTSFFESALQKAAQERDASHLREIDRIMKSQKEMCDTLERQGKELVIQIESRYKANEEKLKAQLEVFQKKESDSSVLIGQRGEQAFEDLVVEHTKWKLTNMSKTAHGTDRSCTVRDCNILFEVKNYSNDVPSEELKKFYRDMEEHNDQHLGVFISMKTPIQTRKQKGYLHIEWTKNSQMLLIFQNFYDHDPKDMLSFIDACADTALTMYRAHSESANSTNLNYQKRIDQAKLYIEKELKRVGDIWKQMKVDKQNFLDMIERVYNTYKYNLDQAKAALQSCTEILLDGIVNEQNEEGEAVIHIENVESVHLAPPPPSKPSAKGKKKTNNNST
jgi:hypothetical protein